MSSCLADQIVDYDTLAAVTAAMVEAWPIGKVTVRRLPRRLQATAWGDAWPRQRLVRYADRAPLSTVCHEVAHLLCPGDGHGPTWQAQFIALWSACDVALPDRG